MIVRGVSRGKQVFFGADTFGGTMAVLLLEDDDEAAQRVVTILEAADVGPVDRFSAARTR